MSSQQQVLYYQEKEIPGSLVKTIISTSLSQIGLYHGVTHRFHAPRFQPNFEALREEGRVFGYTEEDTDAIVRSVLTSVETDANVQLKTNLDLVGEGELPLLSHVRFHEENNGSTEMIYLGTQRFYILATDRSTLMPGDIVKARDFPLNHGSVWNFDIYKDFKAAKPSVPEGFKKYQAWFQTTPVTSIEVCSSPEVLTLIDQSADWGGGELAKLVGEADVVLAYSIQQIRQIVDKLPERLPDREQFSGYPELLKEAKSMGLSTYLLQTLIERIERRAKQDYVYTEKDWHTYIPDDVKEQLRKEAEKKAKDQYKKLKTELDEELKRIQVRKVFLFFLAPGTITDASKKHLDAISKDMDRLAEEWQLGTVGYATSSIANALKNSQPPKGHNLKMAGIIVSVLLVTIFVAYSWLTTKKSMALFDQQLERVEQMVENDEFNEAKIFLDSSHDAFQPGYLRFLISGKTHRANETIETGIDLFVEKRIEQIQTMVRANRNRIDDYTWGLIVEAMEFRPEHPVLNEFREKYIAQ